MKASLASEPFDEILPSLGNRIKTQLIETRPDLSAQISAIVDTETLKIAARRGDLEQEAALIYAKIFTIEELKELSAFYGSETGQKFLKEAPIVSRQMGEASKIWAGGIFRDLGTAVTEEMKKQGLL